MARSATPPRLPPAVSPLEAKLGRHGRITLPLALAAFIALSAWRMWPRGPEVLTIAGPTMGTTFKVTIVGQGLDDDDVATELRALVEAELAEIDRLMSNYRPDSELSRLNAYPSADPFPLSAPTFEVLTIAAEIHDLSGGAFDITIPPLLELWGFGPRADATRPPPPPERLESLRDRVGQSLLRLDPATQSATKGHPALEIDLSAIAPGYAADRIAKALLARGYDRTLVDVGGEFRVHGRNPEGRPWQLGIERPAPDRASRPALAEIIPLESGALATSGDYRSYREVDGRRISHTIDPRSGAPISHRLASVTVIAGDAARADALATALNVLGPEDGLDFAHGANLAVLMIVRTGDGFTTETTAAFDALRAAPGSARVMSSP